MIEFVEVKSEALISVTANIADLVWREYYAEILPVGQIEYMLGKFQSEQAIKQQIGNGYKYYLVRESGLPLGYFAFMPYDEDMFLSKIYIIEQARNQGMGRHCLDYVIDAAKRLNLHAITLTVNKNNLNAIAAYEKMGFSTYSTSTTDIGGGYVMDDLLMRLNI